MGITRGTCVERVSFWLDGFTKESPKDMIKMGVIFLCHLSVCLDKDVIDMTMNAKHNMTAVRWMSTLFLTVLFSFTLLTHAHAHSNLQDRSPTDGEVVSGSLEQVDLWFIEEVELFSGSIKVLNELGEDARKGDPYTDERDAKHVMVPLQNDLPNGLYKVEISVLAKDGHTINESFHFTVKQAEEHHQDSEGEQKEENSESTPDHNTPLQLINSTPSDGDTFTGSPDAIKLVFTERVNVHQGTIALTNDKSEQLPIGTPTLDPNNPKQVTLELNEKLLPGTYRVNWYVTSETGFFHAGTFFFAVDQVTMITDKSSGPPVSTIIMNQIQWMDAAQWLSYAGIFTLFGALWLIHIISPGIDVGPRWIRLGWVLFGISVVGLLGQFFLKWSEIPSATWTEYLSLRAGWIPVAQMILLSAAMFLQRNKLSLIIYGMVILLFSLLGHSSSTQYGGPVAILSNTVHLMALSVWLGGLVALPMLAPTESTWSWLKRYAAAYSKWALGSIIVVALSGIALTFDFSTSWASVRDSHWGKAIGIKTLLLGVIVLFGLLQMRLLRQNREKQGAFFHRIKIELIVGALILLTAAVLVDLSPAAADKSIEPVSVTLQGIEATLSIEPFQMGQNAVTVQFNNSPEIQEVRMRFFMPPDMGGMDFAAFDLGNGKYQVQGNQFHYYGTWEVDVLVKGANGETLVFPFVIQIPEQ
jgi:copper transport protein